MPIRLEILFAKINFMSIESQIQAIISSKNHKSRAWKANANPKTEFKIRRLRRLRNGYAKIGYQCIGARPNRLDHEWKPIGSWTEFRSLPVSHDQLRALDQLLLGGILAYERSQADLAGEMFQKIGARRRNRLDAMIAAAAILAGANLATVNQTDFEPFRAFGLKLYRFE